MSNLFRTNFNLRWTPFVLAMAMLFTTVIAQPTHAVSVVNTIKCNALTLFAQTSSAALSAGEQVMQTTFEFEINAMQAAWKLEDMVVDALRQVSESAFTASLDAFQNRPGIFIKQTAVRTAAVNDYKTTMLDALHVYENNVDAAKASYREDMLALVKAHQEALTNLVNTLVTTINGATATAKANCSDPHVVATLVGVIVQANATLFTSSLAEDAKSFAKAVQLVATRNTAYLQEDEIFAKAAIQATVKLTDAFETRQ